jgi:hypothetical protein
MSDTIYSRVEYPQLCQGMYEIRPSSSDFVVYPCCAGDIAVATLGRITKHIETQNVTHVVVKGLLEVKGLAFVNG